MFALGNKDKWPFESCIISTLGDRFTGTDWTQSIILNDGKAKFTDPEFVETLTYSQAMAPMFNIDFNAINNEQSDNLYGTGKAAATLEGMWTISYFQANADEEVIANTQIAVLPSVPNMKGDANAVSGGAGWSQSVSSKLTGKALDVAIEYVKATTGVEYCEYMMKDSGMLGQCEVPVADMSSMPVLSQRYLELIGGLKLVPIYDIQMDGAVIDVMNSKLQELLSGTVTPQAVAEAIQAEQVKLG
jgi:raffinose/stachyose/melibiose transport system substrate-binding protein